MNVMGANVFLANTSAMISMIVQILLMNKDVGVVTLNSPVAIRNAYLFITSVITTPTVLTLVMKMMKHAKVRVLYKTLLRFI